MSNYSMADIVSITGINAHTLRKWESRYSFIVPKRTATNIRYYTDDQLRKLLNIGILTRNGYRISHIDTLTDEQIHEVVSKILLDTTPQDDINALIVSMLEMNEIDFNEIIERYIAKHGLLKTITELLYPFLNHIGVLWGTNKAMPAQEHFISNLIKQKMYSAIDAIPSKDETSPTIVLYLVEGENHEIGLLLANYIAKELGWRTFYLGSNVPLENIKDVLEITKPHLMLTMFTMLRPAKIEKLITSLYKDTTVTLAVSGGMNIESSLDGFKQVVHLKNPNEFIDLLNQKQNSLLSEASNT
ncbi:MerR family transcriptional regulator [Maribacter sp. HTCC2170]|uniref:MerR family transcriptional regulator n=1 Tax=Maribacter sp. (strain HTCC2170 / KCCM 42371) TaxID=313603 RepID=UPI0002E9227D|nr:MerR family transcriptional regulator [Maribacter sp. HTCC2170]